MRTKEIWWTKNKQKTFIARVLLHEYHSKAPNQFSTLLGLILLVLLRKQTWRGMIWKRTWRCMIKKLAKHTHTHTHTHKHTQNKTNFLPGPACPESQQQECSPPGEEPDRIQFLFTKLRTICCGNISANWSFFFFPYRVWKMILEETVSPPRDCLRRCLCPRRPILGFQGGKNCPPAPPGHRPPKKKTTNPLPHPPQIASKKPRKKRLLVLLWFFTFSCEHVILRGLTFFSNVLNLVLSINSTYNTLNLFV
jgi:hypothetical protein